MASDLVKTSRFLSLVLRHRPESIGLSLDAIGVWLTDHVPAAFIRFPDAPPGTSASS